MSAHIAVKKDGPLPSWRDEPPFKLSGLPCCHDCPAREILSRLNHSPSTHEEDEEEKG